MKKSNAGFTLVEILVVVIIVAIVMSVALLSFGVIRNDRDVQTEVQRFIALTEVAQDDAALQGREFGVELLTAGYRFVEFDALAAQWADVPGDDTLRLRNLPEGMEFELYIEDKRILLDEDPVAIEEANNNADRLATKAYAPHLFIFSSGDTSPYELHLYRASDDVRIVLRGDALGAVEIVDPDEV